MAVCRGAGRDRAWLDRAAGTLENVDIRYASKAVDADATSAKVTLRSAILRNGGFGVYVYSPYVEINAENVLIADNQYTGVFVRADSRHVFRNSTIVGNGFQGTDWYGTGIHLGGANLTLDNTIVAFNRNGLHHHGDPPPVTVRWTVNNIGAAEYAGIWQDLVYLSNDPYLGGDQLLGTIDHAGPLAEDAAYTDSVTVSVPAISGPKYVLVHARPASSQQEAVTTNNLGISSRVLALDVPLLAAGTAVTATAAQGTWYYYRFEGEPGRTVLFSLDGIAGTFGLYLRRDLPPTTRGSSPRRLACWP